MFALAFLLMLVTFRSIVIPIKAILLNLLSVGAAYGVLVLVFQNGNLRVAARLHLERRRRQLAAALPVRGPVRALDGLPRVHPLPGPGALRPRHEQPTEAVQQGISTTAGTVTSAALVMVGVFAVFVTLAFLDFKELGLGLAAAVLIDATIIRGVLLPASMKVLGDWNWYLPSWLEWLPQVGEHSAGPPAKPMDPPAPDEPGATEEPQPEPVPV